jgi:hypothetical protein
MNETAAIEEPRLVFSIIRGRSEFFVPAVSLPFRSPFPGLPACLFGRFPHSALRILHSALSPIWSSLPLFTSAVK